MARKFWSLLPVFALAAVPASAKPSAPAFIGLGDVTQAPRGFVELCASDARLCQKLAGSTVAEARFDYGTAQRDLLLVCASTPMPATYSDSTSQCRPGGIASNGVAFAAPTRGDTVDPSSAFKFIDDPAKLASAFAPSEIPQRPGLLPGTSADIDALTAAPTREQLATGIAPALSCDGCAKTNDLLDLNSLRAAAYAMVMAPVLTDGVNAIQPPARAVVAVASDIADERPLIAKLKHINNRVNRHVRQASDTQTYGVGELWRASGIGAHAVGDCEDLAIEKRVELLDAEFPAERLFFAVVYRPGLGLHTVLVARLDSGDVVLDSRVNFIEKWSRAGYNWVSVQSPGRPDVWRESA